MGRDATTASRYCGIELAYVGGDGEGERRRGRTGFSAVQLFVV